jgi:hypothetical protein
MKSSVTYSEVARNCVSCISDAHGEGTACLFDMGVDEVADNLCSEEDRCMLARLEIL